MPNHLYYSEANPNISVRSIRYDPDRDPSRMEITATNDTLTLIEILESAGVAPGHDEYPETSVKEEHFSVTGIQNPRLLIGRLLEEGYISKKAFQTTQQYLDDKFGKGNLPEPPSPWDRGIR